MEQIIIQPLAFPNWNVEEVTGYKPVTTFWQDFSIADRFGAGAIRSTYIQAFKEWKGNYKYLTELVMVLNHKIWQHYDPDALENPLAEVYNELWGAADSWAMDNLKGDELSYYIQTLD